MPNQSNGGSNGSGPQSPWGNRPSSGGGSGGGGQRGGGQRPPNLDEMIRNSQEKLKGMLPGGGGTVSLFLVLAAVLWLASGLFVVDTDEEAVVLRFGKYTYSAGPGLHWHLPFPVESAETRKVTRENVVDVGSRNVRSGSQQDESLMLAGDENIVQVQYNVVWRINELSRFLFNISEPEDMVKAVSESAMREVVGRKSIDTIISVDRDVLQEEAKILMQEVLDTYESGIEVLRVQVELADAPPEVKDAFVDVQRAQADEERLKNEAQAYAFNIEPRARGNAQRVIEEAEAYKVQIVNRAKGEANRFNAVYQAYKQAKDVTRKRLYLETMEDILTGMDKIILDEKAGAVPYLPLDQLKKSTNTTKENRND